MPPPRAPQPMTFYAELVTTLIVFKVAVLVLALSVTGVGWVQQSGKAWAGRQGCLRPCLRQRPAAAVSPSSLAEPDWSSPAKPAAVADPHTHKLAHFHRVFRVREFSHAHTCPAWAERWPLAPQVHANLCLPAGAVRVRVRVRVCLCNR